MFADAGDRGSRRGPFRAGLVTAMVAGVLAFAAAPANAASHCDVTVADGDNLQTAVTGASAGDTICVGAGTYTGNLGVDQTDVTLLGPNAAILATASRGSEAVIVGTVTMGQNHDGITVDGFRVEGDGHLMRGLNHRFANNVLVGTGGNGMTASTPAAVRDTSFEIVGNSFTGFNQAIRLDGGTQSLSVLIQHNLVTGNTRAIQTFAGLHAGPIGDDTVVAGEILDNVFKDNNDGIRLAGGGFNVNRNVIEGHTTYGMRIGVIGNAIVDPVTDTDATCNWWGALDGPSGDGPGSGDSVLTEQEGTPEGVTHIEPWFSTPTGPCGPQFVSLTPARLLDTRLSGVTVDGLFQNTGLQAAGSVVELQVTGRGGVPADATAVALNVTSRGSTADGFVTVFPCGQDRPNSSNLNYVAGQTIPNLTITEVGTDGKVCLYVESATHLIADVTGAFSFGITPLTPGRLLDTRLSGDTVDGLFQNTGLMAAGSVVELQVTGRGGVPADATAVALNVTTRGSTADGFVTVFPCGQDRPNISNLNYVAGQTIPNLTLTAVGTDGKVCLYVESATHLIADVTAAHTP